MLLERIRGAIDRHRMIEPGGTVLVAVSGGIDSVVLLDALRQLSADYGIALHIAHLDHGLRPTSAADAKFVERLAARLGLPCHGERLDNTTLAAYREHGREGAAREARHAFLDRTASEVGAARIALGHTASDQAETILYRLARGTGIAGLRGIPAVRGPFVRPLIDATRADVLAYARSRGLAWRCDATNADPAFARNRIRHRVVPELEAINPRAIDAVLRASAHAVEADTAIEYLISMVWDVVCACESDERLTLRRDTLSAHPVVVRRLLLREAARRVRGALSGLDADHVEAADELVVGETAHGELSLPGLHLRVQSNEIVLSPRPDPAVKPWSMPLDVGETVIADPPLRLHLEVVDECPAMHPEDRWLEAADADRIVFPLELRSRRDGDRFAPLGLAKRIKLKDFLINERVPFFDRDQLPLLCDREKIVWAVGVRLSDEVRITAETKRYLTMEARQ
jgi:tRNA(Ile)-lysidine synthase